MIGKNVVSGDADAVALAAVMAARLCHDVAGLASTLAGVLELAADPGMQASDRSEAIAMAGETASSLVSRIRVLRAAWGPADGTDLALAATLADSRLSVSMDADLPGRLPPPRARLLLNVVLLGVERLQGRGKIALAGTTEGAVVLLTGREASWPNVAPPPLSSLQPREMQGAWTVLLARQCAATLRAEGPALHVKLPV